MAFPEAEPAMVQLTLVGFGAVSASRTTLPPPDQAAVNRFWKSVSSARAAVPAAKAAPAAITATGSLHRMATVLASDVPTIPGEWLVFRPRRGLPASAETSAL